MDFSNPTRHDLSYSLQLTRNSHKLIILLSALKILPTLLLDLLDRCEARDVHQDIQVG